MALSPFRCYGSRAVALATVAVIGASAFAFPAAAQSTTSAPAKLDTPSATPVLPKLDKLTVTQCKFMADRMIEMAKSFDADHFSREFKLSVGRFETRNFDCSGPPIFIVMKPEDDRGVYIVGKFMFENKQGNIYNSVYIHDPNGIAEVSKKFRPDQVLRVLPPGLAASNAPTPAPGG